MESLSNIQDDIRSKIMRALSNFKKSPKDRLTSSFIETRLDNLEQQWCLFAKTHTDIISNVNRYELHNSDYFKNSVYDEVEDLYLQFKTDLKESLVKLKESKEIFNIATPSVQPSGSNFKLPEIKIPIFSGKYTEWQTFRDLFLGLVHKNKALDDAQKFYYLKGNLVGEAEQLLRNIPISSESYQLSWSKLESIYNNKKFLANGVLKRLLNQKSVASESAKDLKGLINTTSDCLDSIRNLGVDVSSWDILVIHLMSGKLDRETRKAWEMVVSSDPTDELPTFTQFSEFLTSRYRALENLDTKSIIPKNVNSSHSYYVIKDKKVVKCAYCSAGHRINSCRGFYREPVETRRNFIQQKGLCFVCLGNNHTAKFCKNTLRCQICKSRHHYLLHPNGGSGYSGESTGLEEKSLPEGEKELTKEEKTAKYLTTARAEGSNKPLVSCLSRGNCNQTVLLTTALVMAESKNGTYRTIRALLDQGSQGSFITEAMVQYLGLKKISSRHSVMGVGGNKSLTSKYTVIVNVQSRKDANFCTQVKAYVLKSITSILPVVKVTKVKWINVNNDDLADPEYYRPNKIDMLLGADIYTQVIQSGIRKCPSGLLVAQNTSLGWILSGVIEEEPVVKRQTNITVMHCQVHAEELLKRFWELEAEPVTRKRILTEEEIKCERHFTDTFKRNESGRYIVRLPFRNNDPSRNLQDSRQICEKRLKCLERRLQGNLDLKREYTEVIHEYLVLNHMIKLPKSKYNNGVYLPHHAVVREDKKTTKVRVVFDASCKGNMGQSLNDNLMVGPTLQADLRHIIIRWRKHRICLVADIIKMYRQVLVDKRDTAFQRILWRDYPKNDIEEFELKTVTFGTASAPYLAVRVLHQVAYDEGKDDPIITKIVLNDFYMDDLMTGAENMEAAFKIFTDINKLLARGGFQLQKWISNSDSLLNRIKMEERGNDEKLKINIDNITKILGLTWNRHADVFQYSVDLKPLEKPVTKRKIISDISRLFDPLGWLAPSIIIAKIIIQKLWLAGVEWDQVVPKNILNEWMTYRNDLNSLVNVAIPRWYSISTETQKIELHGFCDASKIAYASVVYLRVIDSEGAVNVSLLASKSKVAPIKQVSIPRLELCGAVLLSKLILEIAEVMEITKDECYAWTDSEVVLAWLNGHPNRWKTFVANRVSEILTTLDTKHWFHVRSKENPADHASRGVTPAEISKTSMWFDGPEFLRKSQINYKRLKNVATKLEEVKVHAATAETIIWYKYSSLCRLVRVIAYCKRFLNLKQKPKTICLSKSEIEGAMETCIKRCQKDEFAKEIMELKATGVLNEKRKKFKSLNLFLDSKDIMRVGGRLEMSQLEYDRKHPMLIPKNSFLTPLLIREAHLKTLHGGPQAMIGYLRSSYYIIGIKILVKAYVRKCVTCIRYTTRTTSQLMGQLPSARVTPNKPFLNTGVDYAGPINLRISKGRGNKSYKGYIALFICMATRAVHLEAVSDLTSKGFLAAFKRFVARRGRCAELHSDNGTNFVGAARELRDLFKKEKSTFIPELVEYLANNGTQWYFIPPHAPNFGGLWEAGIKSTKFHLRRVIGNSTLTFEEMSTVLAQIEACLNSRPLSYVYDQNESKVLTPGHFLVGESLLLVPDLNYENSNISTLKRWQLTQRMVQDFWRQWSQDYLNQFLQRHKWAYQSKEPNKGDVVLVKEDDMPPGRWLLARVEQGHPGPDGITRVVTLKTKNSLIKRPLNKICILPLTQ